MKKFRMLIFTLVMVLLTTLSYAYENYNIKAPKYTQPSFHINSRRFGEVKNIAWLENNLSNALLILSSRNKNGTTYSYLYYLNIDNGDSELIYELPSHKILNDIILYDDTFSSNDIITAFDKGIVKTRIGVTEDKKFTYQYESLDLESFGDVNSIDYKGNLFYTKTDDNFIYIKQLYRQPFAFMNNGVSSPDIIKHYQKPYNIVTANNLDSNLTYTSLKKDGLHLYSMNYNGIPLSKLNKPIIRNIVTAKNIGYFGYGYVGMNIEDKFVGNNLNIFMIRRNIENHNSFSNLDSIPFNLDRFGAVPSIASLIFNNEYYVVYTSYDENHKGQIKITSNNQKSNTIVEDENLYGPVLIHRLFEERENKELILYFTYENNEPHAKICDIYGNLIKDITEMLK